MIDNYSFIDANSSGNKEAFISGNKVGFNKLSANETNLIKDKLNEIIGQVNLNQIPLYPNFSLKLKGENNLMLNQLQVGDIVHGFYDANTIWTNARYNGGDINEKANYTNLDEGIVTRIEKFSDLYSGSSTFTLPTFAQIIEVSVNGWSTENYTTPNDTTVVINDTINTGQQVVILYLVDENVNIAPYYTQAQVDAIASNKVDKVVGFGLSKNDFTDVLKAKLDSITAIFTTTLKTTYDNTATALTNLLATGSRLITTGEITKLSNITGTNTGDQDLSGLAPKISPVLTGTPTAPTATVGTNTNQIATTAFVLENASNIPQLESDANDLTVWNNGKGNSPTNTSFGEFALKSNIVISNSFNSAFGNESLSSNTLGTNNTAVGHKALNSNIAGGSNVAVGSFALSAANAYSNVAIGNASLLKTTGSGNSSIGDNSLSENTTGGFNSAIGDSAGRFISDGITPNAITNNSVFLGGNTKSLAANQTNQIVIGFDTIGAGSNTATLGNSSIVRTVLGGVIQKRTLDTAPSSATDTGVLGEIRVTSTYIYVCIATNIWVRTSLSTW